LVTAATDPPLVPLAPLESLVTDWGTFYRKRVPIGPVARNVTDALVRTNQFGPPDSAAGDDGERTIAVRPTSPAEGRQRRDEVATLGGESRRCTVSDRFDRVLFQRELNDPIDTARQALLNGDYGRALELTGVRLAVHEEASVIHVEALANVDQMEAELACRALVLHHPLSTRLRHLHSILLMELDRNLEAAEAVRRVIFLDRNLAMAHFSLGAILRKLGDMEGAVRAYRNAHQLCRSRPPQETVPLSSGERAGELAQAAWVQLQSLSQVGVQGSER
jgi:chemotaxis protein methyltransferase CheR